MGKQINTKMKIWLRTFGCQMNTADSEVAMGIIQASHIDAEFTDDRYDADVILLNTCSVRDHAEQRVFGLLRELEGAKRERPDLIIGIMGCMAVEYKERLFREFPHIDFEHGEERCAQILDSIPDGMMTPGGFAYELRVLQDDEEVAAARREFVASRPAENSGAAASSGG